MMIEYNNNSVSKLKLATALVAVVGISACSTAPSLIAGAPSTHTPQNYETNTSTAAVTINTAGVAYNYPLTGGALGGAPSLAQATGTVNYQTGRIELDDGTYAFVDPDGPAGVSVNDMAGATGAVYFITAGGATYDYVNSYFLSYPVGGQNHYAEGVVGIVTSASDMPNGGSASYSGVGTARFETQNLSGVHTSAETYLAGGNSTVTVDFAAGSAVVDMSNFTFMEDGSGGAYLVGANPADQVRGTGLVVSGSRLSGGTWDILKAGTPVTILGTGTTTASEGVFFGYDPSISAPDEVAGMVLITGATQYGVGFYTTD